jgi:hemerythrin
MEEFVWSQTMSVNNDAIDGHHKKLIQLFNEVGMLIELDQKTPLFSTIKVVSELNVYAIFHFREEERLMEQGDYPELAEHKKLHEAFIEKLNHFKEGYMKSDPLVNYELFDFLSRWIVDHIMTEDMKYEAYI